MMIVSIFGRSLMPGARYEPNSPSPVSRARIVRVALLEHREAEAHQGAALDLALDQRRVDRPPDVEALPQVVDADLAGLVVDLDLRRAGGVGDRGVRRAVDLAGLGLDDRRVRVQVCACPGDQLAVRPRRRCGDVWHADLLLRGALGDHLAVDDLEVVRRDLELLGRDLEQLLLGAQGRLLDRLAGDEGRARRERARADGRRVGVRVVVGDPLVGDAERLGDDLALDRLRPVADVGRAREDVDTPVGLDLDPRLRRVAVLVHPRRVLDRRDPSANMLRHQWSTSPTWATRCSGSRSPSRALRVIVR